MNSRTLRKIAAHYTLCPLAGPIPRAILTFDGGGKLLSIETDVSGMDSLQGVEFFSGVLIPGVVNAHCHLELSHLKGAIPPGTGLCGFVRQVAEMRNSCRPDERLHAADTEDDRMRHSGIIAVGDVCNEDFTLRLREKENGIHYHRFIELFGIDPRAARPALNKGRRTASLAAERGFAHSLTPHSAYSLSEELFDGIILENREKKPLSIHFMESLSERELFRGTGAFDERYRRESVAADFRKFGSPAGRLAASIPSDTPLLLIHNTFVTEEDIDIIQNHFREVTWVVCPRSNHYIEGTLPPVELLRRKGCRIALGTDSLASNTSLSIVDEMKFMQTSTPGATLPELVRWAAWNGAEALGISEWAGTFETGKTPGAVLIDNIDWNRLTLTTDSTARRIV